MKKLFNVSLMFLIVWLMFAPQVFAGGFQLNEHGAKAMGMGGAFTAQANDPSAIFFNPAGLGFQKGMKVMLGTTLMFPSTTFKYGTEEPKMESQIFYPSNFYGTYALENGLVFGLGYFNAYGLGTKWPENWVGRELAVKTDLKTYFINPTAAYKINDQLSLGLGFSYVIASVEMSFRPGINPGPNVAPTLYGDAVLDASANGYNFNFGLLYKFNEDLSFGASYRHSTKLDFSGDVTFTMGPLQSYFPGGEGKTEITLPTSIFAGIAYNFSQDFTVEAGFQYVGWKSYDTLKVNIPVGPVFPLTGKPLQEPDAKPKDWENAYLIRLGAEYRYNDFAFRAGYVYDKTPQPDKSVEPMLPDA
ncbi:MAG: outer membrane protein transport protein, partial [Bacteroidetes bacterium]|nr:outer membrane protein transport protein [Bacteroidota bacterium]